MIAARFKLHLQCENCRRNTSHMLDVPEADDAPRDIEELLESAFLQAQSFFCAACESAIGTIVGVNRVELEEAT
ncbi:MULTISPECIES: hypothetical protein [unclassified Bosea (in: a-proteobacteria)]|uniref:hypothetical protein n=1 Tax=unclassified Bosea (in: a-proteobacteria) TaxID=2653178 RepID=UPI000F7512C5|nr:MULTISPECIES: hypothetical protein [unclassified Bosea (in: a-proteobacteria)]AZO77744.1 hypothetical protein BLM15_09025 [Bosea sp. Tri-49]RXT18358.1 hypothetical protein B5U98_24180 [Bosea sp. Tri-39]RXT32954.1 hypothetical protein B5U99_30525 [Bosea sp. Tri-54]